MNGTDAMAAIKYNGVIHWGKKTLIQSCTFSCFYPTDEAAHHVVQYLSGQSFVAFFRLIHPVGRHHVDRYESV